MTRQLLHSSQAAAPFAQIDIIGAMVICLVGKRENYQVCAILCARIVHSAMRTHMNRPNSSQDCVLFHWAHFTVLRFIFVICVSLYIACVGL